MLRPTALCTGPLLSINAFALSLVDPSQNDAFSSLKDALAQGMQITARQPGQPGGFNNSPDVCIELPDKLGKAAKLMEQFGMGAQVGQLKASMNRVAETAVPQVQDLLMEAVKKMTVADTKGTLRGSDDATTGYLDRSSREQLRAKFLPIAKQATDETGLVKQYSAFASQVATLGVVDAKSANVEGCVVGQIPDGPSEMIVKQEKNVHQNPAVAATSLAKEILDAVK